MPKERIRFLGPEEPADVPKQHRIRLLLKNVVPNYDRSQHRDRAGQHRKNTVTRITTQ